LLGKGEIRILPPVVQAFCRTAPVEFPVQQRKCQVDVDPHQCTCPQKCGRIPEVRGSVHQLNGEQHGGNISDDCEKHRKHDRQAPQQLRPALDPAQVSDRKRR
jgi:hypothetical protein